MASSSKSRGPYDVFLSFRGEDVRKNFVGHLYNALVQSGIRTFRDSEELWKGDNISMIMEAIKESRIAVIVFSENYAFSWWCLEEVAKIMELSEQKILTVRPVFYKVDPNEVRKGRTSYAEGLAKHESKHGKDSTKMERWKKALWDAGHLVGWTLTDKGDEAKVIQEIVKDISTHLSQTPFVVAEHPVGIKSRVAKVKSMLKLESKDVLVVGLWGQGGIGKTALGRAIFNDISKTFDGSSFLANVREKSKDGMGLVALQEQLLNDTLLRPEGVRDVACGKSLIQHRLCCKRVLVILDDVDDVDQLRALAGKTNWFGSGSRILVTTRDKHLLTRTIDRDLVYVYEVEALEDVEARALLRKHAFPMYEKLKSKRDLLDGFLNHAGGLPLALEVLGSLLCGTTEDVWESILKKLSKTPNKKINNVLKVSYDNLEKNEQDIFLHIACFFKGRESDYTKRVLDGCELEAAIGFDILIKRCLLRIERRGIQINDLVQMMGKDIVNQESDDPGRRSRLWMYEDVVDVLSRGTENFCVKAIVLEPRERIKICANADAFAKMRTLRLLILDNVSFQSPVCLPNEVRWFKWPDAPQYPEFSSGPKKLVGLEMPGGRMTFVPKSREGFRNLKSIDFRGCRSLVCTPDISCTPNLEELCLEYCGNLIEAHESIAYHDKLQVLNLMDCYELSVFPNVLKSKNLRDLDLAGCKKFEKFPEIPHELKSLEMIALNHSSIKGLPSSIENLVSLKIMVLYMCENLVSLPPSIYKLQKLEQLDLGGCTNLIEFPRYKNSADRFTKTGLSNLRWLDVSRCNLSDAEFLDNPSCFPFLTQLDLSENNIASLPTSINKRDRLSSLKVNNCHQLREIPELPPFLSFLVAAGCESLQNLGDLTSVHHFVRRALNVVDGTSFREGPFYNRIYGVRLPGGKMPEWILPVEKDFIYFMVSKDLYNKFLGFALFVSYVDEPKFRGFARGCHVSACVNGKERGSFPFFSTEWRDHLELDYCTASRCFREGDFIWPPFTSSYRPSDTSELDRYIESVWRKRLEDDFSRNYDFNRHAIFSLAVPGEIVKEWGIRIICKRLDDDPRVVPPDNRLMNPALIYEVGSESTDSEAESSLMHEEKGDLKKEIQDNQLVDPVLLWEVGYDSIDSRRRLLNYVPRLLKRSRSSEDLQDCQ